MGLVRHDSCILCGAAVRRRYDDVPDRLGTSDGQWSFDECASCGFAFVNPAPTGDLSRYYPDNYLSQEDAGSASEGLLSRLERLYRYDQYRFDFRLLRECASVDVHRAPSYLDVGCGSGERVTYVAERGCPRSVGIDRYAFGKTASRGAVELVNTEIVDYRPVERFAVVSMFHVLEHVENPHMILDHLRQAVLAPEGVLIVQVPNYGAFERRLFGRRWFGLDAPRHLLQFNSRTVRMTLERAGYDVIDVVARNAPLHPVTLVPSAVPALDVQRIWVRPGSRRAKIALQLLWAVATLAAVPFAWLQNLTGSASMLTVIAKPRRGHRPR